jgi:antitoxin PrlF
MTTTLQAESTLTARYQTTVPEIVRQALQLNKRDKIRYTVRPNGEVVIKRVEPHGEDDPALEQFVEFLAADITHHPDRLQGIDPALREQIQSLVGDVEVDLSDPLPVDDE